MDIKTYNVEGLSCIDCADQIQKSVGKLEGIKACELDYATGLLTLQVDDPAFDDEAVTRIVEDTGHTLRTGPWRQEVANPVVAFARFLFAKPDTTLTAAAALLTLTGLLLALFDLPEPVQILPVGLAIGIGGWPVLRQAFWEIVRARSLGINTLMVIAVIGAIFIGEWIEAAIVVVLFALGEALEGYATERARGALESLLDLVPPVALRLGPEGNTEEVLIEELSVGDRVLVRPGDRVSVDGVVQAGQSAVDQAPITGESVPVDKSPGDEVFAGTVNTFGALEVQMTRPVSDNTLNRMIALVQEAQSRQAPVQRFVERFARVYTPAVTVLAFLVATVPPLFFGQPFWGESGWLMRALQMLVIACPCALVISTPVSVVSALTNAAARGVLVKGGRTLEALGQVQVFAFDKTGTLTEGRPVTTDVLDVCEDLSHPHNGLAYAAAVEAQSSHPLARALVTEAEAQEIAVLPAEEVAILSGRGVTGQVNGSTVTVASHPYFDATVPHAETVCREADRLAAEGKTVMMVCHDDQVCSIFAVADRPRLESAETLASLRALGDIHTVMLTGDGAAVAEAIGQLVGVDDVRAELLPEDKVSAIREMAASEKAVAMVGDGVNDAPALAQANVGIAMGGAGSAQAMETADVVLMGDDLSQLPFIVRLSRRTRQIIRANVIFALAVKVLVFSLAAAGLATLWMAIAADVGASLLVILNGMRLRKA